MARWVLFVESLEKICALIWRILDDMIRNREKVKDIILRTDQRGRKDMKISLLYPYRKEDRCC